MVLHVQGYRPIISKKAHLPRFGGGLPLPFLTEVDEQIQRECGHDRIAGTAGQDRFRTR